MIRLKKMGSVLSQVRDLVSVGKARFGRRERRGPALSLGGGIKGRMICADEVVGLVVGDCVNVERSGDGWYSRARRTVRRSEREGEGEGGRLSRADMSFLEDIPAGTRAALIRASRL